MLTHIVLFRRKLEVERDEVLERSLMHRLRDLDGPVEAICDWKISANALPRPTCWDWVLEAQFEDDHGLEQYLRHPLHTQLLAELVRYFECAVCDYYIEGNASGCKAEAPAR